MNNIVFAVQDYIIDFVRIFIISNFTINVGLRVINIKDIMKEKILKIIISILLINTFCIYIQEIANTTISIVCLNFLLSILFSNITINKIGYSILITTLSLSINYIIYTVSTIICFIIFKIINIDNKYIIMIFMTLIYIVLMIILYHIKRCSKGKGEVLF